MTTEESLEELSCLSADQHGRTSGYSQRASESRTSHRSSKRAMINPVQDHCGGFTADSKASVHTGKLRFAGHGRKLAHGGHVALDWNRKCTTLKETGGVSNRNYP